jgi:hypothetical protein
MVHAALPKTKGDIRAAVNAAWVHVTPAHLMRASARVCRKMAMIEKAQKGGGELVQRLTGRKILFKHKGGLGR